MVEINLGENWSNVFAGIFLSIEKLQINIYVIFLLKLH